MLDILHEDNHCLAVNKPAGLPVQGDETGDECLLDRARADLKARYHKPGNVFVGLVHRLDRPVSGVVLLAKTSKGAARLSEQFRDGTVEKLYWAVVEGRLDEDQEEWRDVLSKDPTRNVVRVVRTGEAGGQDARLAFRVLERRGDRTVVELRPITGRSHQLRVQLASRGLPIVGDRKYGAKTTVAAVDGGHRIALHARSLGFTHPTSREALVVVAPVPADWPDAAWRGR
jgi:23S rRNA pseudouridine1911/1915/1917 synthase